MISSLSKEILFISSNDWVPWGGSEVLWSRAALNLQNTIQGVKVTAHVREWLPQPPHLGSLIDSGVNLIYKKKEQLPFHLRALNRLLPTVSKFTAKSQTDLILNNKSWSLVVLSLGDHNDASDVIASCRKNRLPYVIIVQLAKSAAIPADGNLADTIKSNYLEASKIFFVSLDNRTIVERQIAASLSNAEIISNPLPILSLSNRPKFPSTFKEYCLGFVASLSSNHKGHDLLFQVLANEKWRQRDLKVNLYGTGPHEKFLRDLKQHYDLDNVRFCGFSDGIAEIWNKNHAAILCSRMEGQSLALLEAMSYNRMPIVTDVGDARALIEDGVNGFIADAPTVKHIDEALEKAWSRRAEWEAMGIKAGNTLRALRPEDPVEVLSKKLLALL